MIKPKPPNPKISICIPTYEYHGKGVKYLTELLDTITTQTFKDFDIVISDQSKNSDIKDLINTYSDLAITYIKNSDGGNSISNTNNAVRHATGKIIKIIFQDDLFVSNNALEKINSAFDYNGCKWLVSGCNHTLDGKIFNRNHIPMWNSRMLYGVNTIGAPSVLSFINENVKEFDANIITLMDCEYYYQLHKEYGLPYALNDIQIGIRGCEASVSSQPGGYLHADGNPNLNKEIDYVISKHQLNRVSQ